MEFAIFKEGIKHMKKFIDRVLRCGDEVPKGSFSVIKKELEEAARNGEKKKLVSFESPETFLGKHKIARMWTKTEALRQWALKNGFSVTKITRESRAEWCNRAVVSFSFTISW